MNNIDKLFSDSIEIFGAVEFKKASIVTAILKIIVKVPHFVALFFPKSFGSNVCLPLCLFVLQTSSESLRLCTFSRSGFQQIQVDIEFLRVHFWKFVTDEG